VCAVVLKSIEGGFGFAPQYLNLSECRKNLNYSRKVFRLVEWGYMLPYIYSLTIGRGNMKTSKVGSFQVIFVVLVLTMSLMLVVSDNAKGVSVVKLAGGASLPSLARSLTTEPEAAGRVSVEGGHSVMSASASGCSGVSFAQPVGSPVRAGTTPFSVATGDFNLDGKLDLVVANSDSHNLTVLLCDGSGGFTQAVGSPVATGPFPRFVAVGDLNLDGKPDLVVTNFTSNNVTILLGNGSGGFMQPAGSPVDVGTAPLGVAVGDFDLDGKPDLAVANFNSNNLTILLGDGSGGFNLPGLLVGTGDNPFAVSVGDFNLDGKPDVAVANENSDDVTILLGNGSGGFMEAVGSPIAVGSDPRTVVVGDFNLDGKPDLAVANGGNGIVTILLGNGSGGFSQPGGPLAVAGAHPFSAAIADFNQDGKPDLAVIIDQGVAILLGNGSGGFTQPDGSPVGAGGAPLSVAVGDFNLDGKPDLAAANEVSNDVTIQLNTCDAFPCSGVDFIQPAGSPVGAGTNPASVAVGDFNLDGKPDFAAVNANSDNVTIQLGNGIGGFSKSAGSPVSTGHFPTFVAAGDFNLDGKPDLAVTNNSSNSVTILLGDGSGGFTQPAGSPVGAGTFPNSLAVGDFNLDGKPDLAVTNQANNVTILLGNGGGGFSQAAGSPIGAGTFPDSVAVGDFNLDGKPDLAVANLTSNNVTILLGNGSGGFTQAAGSPVGAGTFPVSVVVGDFNQDGKPDLAVANPSSNNVTILLGNGSGGFTQSAGSPVAVGTFPLAVAVGDFNLDGKPDLAAANNNSNNVTVLLGNGSGGFTHPTRSPVNTGTFLVSISVGDFNLDGKPDLAMANQSDNVTILLNSCTASPCNQQQPTITCPGNVTVAAAASCPIATGALANFTVTASNDCGAVTSVCSPPSGSTFPVGTTTVTCTATDASGNTAQCTFTVTAFGFCLQDETSPGNIVLVNAQTGEYYFCCGGEPIASGNGTLNARGCIGTIDSAKGDRKIHIQWDTSAENGAGSGTAFVQKFSNKTVCQISDRNMSNNTCQCLTPTPLSLPRHGR
jgi:hypothetical protein